MKPKYKVDDSIIYDGEKAIILEPPDTFGQLLIYQGGEELWVFEEEIKPLKEANHGKS